MKLPLWTFLPLAASTLALLALCPQAPQQDPKPAAPPDAKTQQAKSPEAKSPEAKTQDPKQKGEALAKDLLTQFAEQKIVLDLEKGTMTIDAIVNAPPDPIEYVLIHRKGKKHEAMFYTTSKPSILNAGFLMLGLEPGKGVAIIGFNCPEWVVVENVASGARLWVDDVCEGLEQLGYATLPVPVCADWLGAPYERARIFVVGRRPVADAHRDGEPAVSVDAEVARASSVARVVDGAREASDADRIELRKQHRGLCGPHGEAAPVALVDRWREPMPLVDGVVSRAPRRMAQHAAGNCVVPAQAAVIGYMIQELVMVKLEQNPVISGSAVLA